MGSKSSPDNTETLPSFFKSHSISQSPGDSISILSSNTCSPFLCHAQDLTQVLALENYRRAVQTHGRGVDFRLAWHHGAAQEERGSLSPQGNFAYVVWEFAGPQGKAVGMTLYQGPQHLTRALINLQQMPSADCLGSCQMLYKCMEGFLSSSFLPALSHPTSFSPFLWVLLGLVLLLPYGQWITES